MFSCSSSSCLVARRAVLVCRHHRCRCCHRCCHRCRHRCRRRGRPTCRCCRQRNRWRRWRRCRRCRRCRRPRQRHHLPSSPRVPRPRPHARPRPHTRIHGEGSALPPRSPPASVRLWPLEAAAELVLGTSAAGPGPRPVMRRGLCLARRRHQGIVSCPRCRTASRRPRATLRPSPPTPMPLHLLRFAPAAPDRQNSATQRRPDAGKQRRPAKQRTRMYTKSNRPSTVPDARRPPTRRRKHWRFPRAPPPLVRSSAAASSPSPALYKKARHVATHRGLAA